MSEAGWEDGRTEKMENSLNFPRNTQWSQVGSVHVLSHLHTCLSLSSFTQEGLTEHTSGLTGKESHPLHFPNSHTVENMVITGNSNLHSRTGVNKTAECWELKVTAHTAGCPGLNVFVCLQCFLIN